MKFVSLSLEKAFIWIMWAAVNFHRIDSVEQRGLVGFWPLNSKYGTRDVSGNGNHGELHGNVLLSRGKKGEKGGAYRFLGSSTDDFIKIPNNGALDTSSSMTMMLWYQPEGAQPGPILNYNEPTYSSSLGYGVHLWDMSERNIIYFRLTSRDGNFFDPVINFGTTRNWQHVAVTYDRSLAKAALYINGTLKQQQSIDSQMATQHAIYMGNRQRGWDSRCLKAKVSCVKIYNVALSQQEITSAMSRCLQDSPIDGMWTLRHDGSRLSSHVTASRIVHSRSECVAACIATGTCRSINFNTCSLSGEFSCELNSEDEDALRTTLTKAIGMEYWDED